MRLGAGRSQLGTGRPQYVYISLGTGSPQRELAAPNMYISKLGAGRPQLGTGRPQFFQCEIYRADRGG